MRSLQRLAPVAVLASAALLTACGDGDGDRDDSRESSESSEETSEPTTDGTTGGTTDSPPTAAAELPAPCDVLSIEDVEAAYGLELTGPSFGGGGYSEGEYEWQGETCGWESEELVEVQLSLTGPEDFQAPEAGTLACPEPPGITATVHPVDGLGDRAFWEESDFQAIDGNLRVCTAEFNFDIEIEFEDGATHQGDPREQTIALARQALTVLGG